MKHDETIKDLIPLIHPASTTGASVAVRPKSARNISCDELTKMIQDHPRCKKYHVLELWFLFKKQDEAHEPECRHVCWETEI